MKYLKKFEQFVNEDLTPDYSLEKPDGTVADYKELTKSTAERLFSGGDDEFKSEDYIDFWITQMVDYYNIPDNYYWYHTDNDFPFADEQTEIDSYTPTEKSDDPGSSTGTIAKHQSGDIEFYIINHEGGEELFMDPEDTKYVD